MIVAKIVLLVNVIMKYTKRTLTMAMGILCPLFMKMTASSRFLPAAWLLKGVRAELELRQKIAKNQKPGNIEFNRKKSGLLGLCGLWCVYLTQKVY